MTDDLTIAIGTYPHTKPLKEGRVRSDLFSLEFAEILPVNRAFAPMVRELRFDVSEMAIATYLQAKAFGVGITLLPITVVARFQQSALLCRADSPLRGPGDLKGRRVGVRSYSQTTGLWLRGILAGEFGVRAEDIRWITFEGAHVAEVQDPAWVRRAPEGASLLAMLRDGSLDAVIMGNDLPDSSEFRPVFPDAAAASAVFFQRHGFVPVNHLLTVRRDLADTRPDVVVGLMRLFRMAFDGVPNLPMGRATLAPAVALAIRYAAAQGLLSREVAPDEVWTGLPEDAVFG